ncbi:hypothetical protein MW887_000444 [Aspergillus wentii]|nr:hypothetical protein MW887_000444 [Aspergillus wentii]
MTHQALVLGRSPSAMRLQQGCGARFGLRVDPEEYNPPNLWQAAFDLLEEKQKQILMTGRAGTGQQQNDDTAGSEILVQLALDTVIETVKKQYDIRKQKKEKSRLHDYPRKILGAALGLQGIISEVVKAVPTGLASSAWTVISLGLNITQNYRKQQESWLEASAFLSDTVSRLTLIEVSYRRKNPATKDGVENALIQTYVEILRYSAEVMAIHESNRGMRILQVIAAMNDLPLHNIKGSIESQQSRLEGWLSIQQYLEWNENARGDEILRIAHGIDENVKLLNMPWVSSAVFGCYDRFPEDECLPGTRVELLERVTDWIDSPSGGSLFWLNGMAGTGKSTISRSFARLMQERGLLGASFFFKRDETDRANLIHFIPTIARQLADALPGLRKSIMDAAGFASSEIPVQFNELLCKPLSMFTTATGQRLQQVIVIDALDECEDGNLKALLQLLPRLHNPRFSVDLRVFVTSRPEEPIGSLLKDLADKDEKAVLHNIDESIVERDLQLFFQNKMSEIQKEREDEELEEDWPGQEKIQVLVTMTVPLFVSAATIYRELKIPALCADDILNEILDNRNETSKLAAIYLPVQVSRQIRDVVGSIVILEDTLPVGPLAELIGMERLIVKKRVNSLSSVLQVPEKPDDPQSRPSSSDLEMIHSFLNAKLLPWFEAMSILGLLHEAVQTLDTLQSLVQMHKDSLSKFLYDAKRFLLKNKAIAEEAPLQLYSSGLIFAPSECTVKKAFQRFRPQCFTQLPLVSPNWGAALQTFEEKQKDGDFRTVALSPDGLLVASTSWGDGVKIWNTATGSLQQTLDHQSWNLYSVEFSPDGKMIAAAFDNGTVSLWDMTSGIGVLQHTFQAHSDHIYEVVFSANGKKLASASKDEKVKLWNIDQIGIEETLEGHTAGVLSVAFSPDGKMVASASSDWTVRLWNIGSSPVRLQAVFKGHSSLVGSVAFSPDSKFLVSGSRDETLRLWDIKLGELKHTFTGHCVSVESVVFLPDGQSIVSGSWDKTIKIWDISSGAEKCTLVGHTDWVSSVSLSGDGTLLASGSDDRTMRLWDISQGIPEQHHKREPQAVPFLIFSPDQSLVASVHGNGATLWNSSTGERLHSLDLDTMYEGAVAFSPDSQTIASGSRDSATRIWSTSSGTLTRVIEGHGDVVCSLAFSSDGTLMASGSFDSTVKLWDMASGELLQTMENPGGSPFSLSFSHDNKRLAVGCDDDTIRIWDTDSRERPRTLRDLDDEYNMFNSLAFSPDDKLLAAGAHEALRVWDTVSGIQIYWRDAYLKFVPQVSFSDDGRLLNTNEKPYSIDYDEEGGSVSISETSFHIKVREDESWLQYDKEKILWLPPEYRANNVAIKGNLAVLGHESGQYSFIRLADIAGDRPDLLPG